MVSKNPDETPKDTVSKEDQDSFYSILPSGWVLIVNFVEVTKDGFRTTPAPISLYQLQGLHNHLRELIEAFGVPRKDDVIIPEMGFVVDVVEVAFRLYSDRKQIQISLG